MPLSQLPRRALRAAATGLVSAAALLSPGLHAQPTDQTFDVTLSLSASCTIGSINALNFGTYTSGQTTAATGSTSASITCPEGVSFTPSLVGASGPDFTKTTKDSQTGLDYTLSINGGSSLRTSAGTALTVTIDGSIAAGQSGCATDTCRDPGANRTHTLRLTY